MTERTEDPADDYMFFQDAGEGSDENVIALVKNRAMKTGEGDPEELYRDPLSGFFTGYAATFFHANSGVSWGSVHSDNLGKRLSEEEAREIHPRLFERLERDAEIEREYNSND